jgi:hypothetical protein
MAEVRHSLIVPRAIPIAHAGGYRRRLVIGYEQEDHIPRVSLDLCLGIVVPVLKPT